MGKLLPGNNNLGRINFLGNRDKNLPSASLNLIDEYNVTIITSLIIQVHFFTRSASVSEQPPPKLK